MEEKSVEEQVNEILLRRSSRLKMRIWQTFFWVTAISLTLWGSYMLNPDRGVPDWLYNLGIGAGFVIGLGVFVAFIAITFSLRDD